MADVDIALWERNLNVISVERVVDALLYLCADGNLLLNKNPEGNVQVNAVVAEIVEDYTVSLVLCRADDVAAQIILLNLLFDTFHEQLAHFLYVCTVSHANRDFYKLVQMVLC